MARTNGIRPPIDAPTISLPASFSILENIGSIPITVTRSGNLTVASIVPYSVISITAGIADYTTATSGTLIFAIGDSVKTIPNSIIDDLLIEPTEQYLFLLGADDSTWVRGNNACVISILDNDTIGASQTIASITSPTAAEGAVLVFSIALTGMTQVVQSFAFSLGGTATAGTDYALPIVFSSGVTISGTNLIIPIGISGFTGATLTTTDSIVEGTETLILMIGGVTGTGNITDVVIGSLTAITRMTAFETPYGMLTSAQQTATATSGGYITACASRSDTNSDNYAIDISTTGPSGTYTRLLDNRQYSPYAEVINVLSYQHADIPFVNEFDLPTTLTANTIGVIQDANGLQEFGLYSTYATNTVAGVSTKLFTGSRSAIFDTPPISVVDGNTAKIFLLNNLAQDTVLRTSGTTVHLKFISKLGSQEYVGAVTPIAVTIASRASKPLPPRNVLFGVNGELYSFPSFQFPANYDTTFQIDTASRAETTPSGFFNPSYTNEAGVTYEADLVGANGVYKTKQFTLGATNTFVYTTYERETTDLAQGSPSYRFYAVKAGVRSLPFSYDLLQDNRGYQSVTAATATLSGANVSILVTFGANSAPTLIDYLLGGDVFTTQAFGTITCDSGVLVMSNQKVQVPPGVTSFTMTVPTISATGKTLTTAWGNYAQYPTSTTLLTVVTDVTGTQTNTTETYARQSHRFNATFAAPCVAGAYPYSFAGTATFGGAFGTTPLAGADYTVEALYYPSGVETSLTMTNSTVNVPAGVSNFYLEIHPILDAITEGQETLICTVGASTTNASFTIIAANAT